MIIKRAKHNMSKCFHCRKEFDLDTGILLGSDGDFVCSYKCEQDFEKDKEIFFNNIHDDKWYSRWLENK